MNDVTGLKSPIMVVDLDGTLIASDMLYEAFWDAFSRHWLTPLRALPALLHSRAALKRFLCQSSQVDIKTLLFKQESIDYVKAWRRARVRTVLETTSDHESVQKFSAYFDISDEAPEMKKQINLKGVPEPLSLHKNRKVFSKNLYLHSQYSQNINQKKHI